MEVIYLFFVIDVIFWLNCIFCLLYFGDFFIGMLNNSMNVCKIVKYYIKVDVGLLKYLEIICNIENWNFSFLIDNINGGIIVVDYFLCSIKGMDCIG